LIGVEWELHDLDILERLRDGGVQGIGADGGFTATPVLTGVAQVLDDLSDDVIASWKQTFPELVLIVSLGVMDCAGAYVKDCNGNYILPVA
jgi:hypothetical protein